MSTTFQIRVTGKDAIPESQAWRCPVLLVPGAKLEEVFVDGVRVDDRWYTTSRDRQSVEWTRDSKLPANALLTVKLKSELSFKWVTDLFKALTIVLPLLTSLVSVLIARRHTVTVTGGLHADGVQHFSADQTILLVAPPHIHLTPDGAFDISEMAFSKAPGSMRPSLVISMPGFDTVTVHLEKNPPYGTTDYHVEEENDELRIKDPIFLTKSGTPYSGGNPAALTGTISVKP
jgi:hypothetical protein